MGLHFHQEREENEVLAVHKKYGLGNVLVGHMSQKDQTSYAADVLNEDTIFVHA
jgi:hypothetical protein